MKSIFDWDDGKAARNFQKHGVSFEEASTVFDDEFSATAYDPRHSIDEDGYLTIGLSHAGRLLMIAHTKRGDVTWITNAREVTASQRKIYEGKSQR